MIRGIPYWRLSLFYLFYFACLGAWVPFWPLYLDWLGYGSLIIGSSMGLFHAMRVVAPNLWAHWARGGSASQLRVIR